MATIKPNPKFCNFTITASMRRVQRERSGHHHPGDAIARREFSLKNTKGERAGPTSISAYNLSTPDRFREWCLNRGNFVWGGGVKELFALHKQIATALAKRT